MFMKREHKTADCQQEKDEVIYMEEKTKNIKVEVLYVRNEF